MSNKNVDLLFRGQLTTTEAEVILAECVWTNLARHISKTIRCGVATLKGVDGGDLDLWIDTRIASKDAILPQFEDNLVFEAWRKLGSFDGTPRLSLTLRLMDRSQRARLDSSNVKISRSVGTLNLIFKDILHTFQDLSRTSVDQDHAERIFLWHWSHYYNFLPSEDVRNLTEVWAMNQVGLDIVETNREASRQLYQMARDYGWCKLTRREQEKYGLTGQWHQRDSLRRGTTQGVGQATLEAAAGLPVPTFNQPE